MKYVGWGVWIKAEISLFDVTVVCDLARAAAGKSLFVRLQYYKKIVAQITTLKRVWFWHAFMVKRILVMADMLGGKKTEYDPKEKINNFVFWLAPRVGTTPHEILHNLNSESLQKFSQEAINYNIHRESAKAMMQHMPAKYFEEIQKVYDYKRVEARQLRDAEIDETMTDPDPDSIQIERITRGLGYDGGYHG